MSKNKGTMNIRAGQPTVPMQKDNEDIVAAIHALQETNELVSIVIHDYSKDQDYQQNSLKWCSGQRLVVTLSTHGHYSQKLPSLAKWLPVTEFFSYF